jgi:hypothetical protein
MLSIQLSFTGQGRVLRVTPETARWLFFRVFHITTQNKLELELPKHRWRDCGMGLIDHLHRRCTHEDLSTEELDWLERGLNLLLAKRRYKLFPNEGSLEHIPKAPKHRGLYTQRCGAIFLLEPLSKDRLALETEIIIARQDLMWDFDFFRFLGVKIHKGNICFRLQNFFSGLDESLSLEDFQKKTRQILRVVKTLPTEQIYPTQEYWGWYRHQTIEQTIKTQITLRG